MLRLKEARLLLADLFAILKTTEKLERAWTRDLVSAKEYEPLCAKLIAQFKTLWGTLRDSVSWQHLMLVAVCRAHCWQVRMCGRGGICAARRKALRTCAAALVTQTCARVCWGNTGRHVH